MSVSRVNTSVSTNSTGYLPEVTIDSSCWASPVTFVLSEFTGGEEEEPPVASFTYSPESPVVNETISFTSESYDTDGSIITYYWSFGDGKDSTKKNPKHVFTEAGEYDVRLTVTDDDGLQDSAYKTITVGEEGGGIPAPIPAPEEGLLKKLPIPLIMAVTAITIFLLAGYLILREKK